MKRPAFAGSLMLALLIRNLAAQTPPPTPPDGIPAIAFFQPSDFFAPALSPSGRLIGFIGRTNGHACLFLLDRATGKIQGLFSPGEGQVERFWWKGDHRVLVAAHGDEGLEYFAQEIDGPPRKIPSLKGTSSYCINPLPGDIDQVISFPGGYGRYVTAFDLRTGRGRKVETLEGGGNDCVTSLDGELRAWTNRLGKSWFIKWRSDAKSPWHERKGKSDILPFRPFAMDADDRHLLVFAYDQGNTTALMRLDPNTDERALVVQYPDRDIQEVFTYPGRHAPAHLTSYRFGEDDFQVLDETAKPFYARLAQSLPGTSIRWISSSADGSQRIVQSWSARDPGRFYLFDDRSKTLSLLGQSCLDLPAAAMGEVRYFTFQTRDAVSESGYVVLPAKTQVGSPPLLVIPMEFVGEAADPGRGFNPLAQFFASRGFAVARFATRGSFGFGRSFERAGDLQVDGRIVQDTEDGVNDLARKGLADSHRVGILGWGASGVIALRMAASSPQFRAVAVVNSWASFDVTNISWLTSSEASGDVIIDQLGGDQNVYDKFTHQLDPEVSVRSLSATTFLAYSSWYDRTPEAAGRLRGFFQRYKKPYEWYELDVHQANRPEVGAHEYDARLYTRMVEFLRRTL